MEELGQFDKDFEKKQEELMKKQQEFEFEQKKLEEKAPELIVKEKRKRMIITWGLLILMLGLVVFLGIKLL